MRTLIWRFYHDLKAYRADPPARRQSELRARFDHIFRRRAGFVTLDRPEIPLHTNGSERDIRLHVTKRKISGGTRSVD